MRQGDAVRIRIGNLTMTNHPIHLHGHHFSVTCTDGGWVPESAQWPEVTIDVPVGAMRAIEFVADDPGDWAFHCHKSHHTMNAMGHDGEELHRRSGATTSAKRDRRASCRTTWPWARTAWPMMGDMEMPLPDNTLPMMTGTGPFGPIEMGGMFTVMKVREGLARRRLQGPGLVQASRKEPSPARSMSRARVRRREPQHRRRAWKATAAIRPVRCGGLDLERRF